MRIPISESCSYWRIYLLKHYICKTGWGVVTTWTFFGQCKMPFFKMMLIATNLTQATERR